MTLFEHAMLGVAGVAASGLHRRCGWQILAAGGVVAVLPDWDGLALVVGPVAFDRAHRAWGHGLLSAGLLGGAAMWAMCRFRLVERTVRLLRLTISEPGGDRGPGCEVLWLVAGLVTAWIHLAADVLYSGHDVLPDWGIKLLWPFSQQSFAWPMVPWGDVGTTLILVASMFAMARWPGRLQTIGVATLVAVAGYVIVRGAVYRSI